MIAEITYEDTDLYTILMRHSIKHNTPYIDVRTFVPSLEKYALSMSHKDSSWLKWTVDTEEVFLQELTLLRDEEKCDLIEAESGRRVYMPHFISNLIQEYYKKMDEDAALPFPNEEIIKMKIPASRMLSLGMGSALASYLEAPLKTPPPLIKISFPVEYGSVLLLPDYMPKYLSDHCLYKVRNYLNHHGNMDYVTHKIVPFMSGKEIPVKTMLNQLLTKPHECYESLIEGSDFNYMFWVHFCNFLKNETGAEKELSTEELSAIQAVYFLETLSNFFKNKAAREKAKEEARDDLVRQLNKAPYIFNLSDIMHFSDSNGVSLLNILSNEELEAEIRRLTTESKDLKLPELLIFKESKENLFVMKTRILNVCSKMFSEARSKVKQAVTRRWIKLIREFYKEGAMENDREFDKLLEHYLYRRFPLLSDMLEDPKFRVAYNEIIISGREIPMAIKIFSDGELLPFSDILAMKRKDILFDAKLSLPFWYSIPFLAAIIAFFSNSGKKQKSKEEILRSNENDHDTGADRVNKQDNLLAIEELESSILPEGKRIDDFMDELTGRWVKLIDKHARAELVADVNSLVRDNLKRTLRVVKKQVLTREQLNALAGTIVHRNPSLQNLDSEGALIMYIELCLIKLLKSYNN